jgi:misacylated tRNA(Ala) deacylase
MRELNTDLHILNALVFREFAGALVTGAQMNEDGTARIDFDLPDADNDGLRALEGELNDVVRQDLTVAISYVPMRVAESTSGLLRSRSVTPPPSAQGLIRIVEIAGLDSQACGGTHLASTGGSRPIRILKIENKGRHNRRVRIGLKNATAGGT